MNFGSFVILLLSAQSPPSEQVGPSRFRDPCALAFSARIYFPDKRKSRLRLYLSDLKGRHRREIETKQEPWGVRWSGRNCLVWVEGGLDRASLMAARGPGWKPGRLHAVCSIVPVDDETVGDRGVPRYRIGERLFEVRSGKVRRIHEEAPDFTVDRGYIKERGGTRIDILDPVKGQPNNDPARMQPILNKKGVKVRLEADGFFLDAYPGRSPHETWITTWEPGELHAEFETITAINWKTRSSKVIAARLAGEDISRHDPIYATCTRGGRSLEYWQPIDASIWISGIQVGNYETGDRWSVLGGWVYANGVTVRPTPRDLARRKP